MQKILIVEDEVAIADTVVYALQTEGYAVEHVTLGSEALASHRSKQHALVVLDVGLPDMNGFEVCRALRKFSDAPVIFLTARNDEIDRVVGLEIGADDYVAKPFSPRELTARVRVILRRLGKPPGIDTPAPSSRDQTWFEISANDSRISYAGQLLDLTRYEYQLLKVMIPHTERIFSRAELMQAAWTAPDHSTERTVDTHIKTLRAKLKAIVPTHDPIETHRGLGYSLRLPQ
jgi:two-component system catabolic regulation response regulator CreB